MTRCCLAALLAVVCLAPARGQSPEQKKATIAYLRDLQTPDGGLLPARPGPKAGKPEPPTLGATSAGLRALKYFGGEVQDRGACARFVRSCYDKESGGFANTPGGKPAVIPTAVGLMAVTELKLPAEEYTPRAVKFLAEHARAFEEVRMAAAGLESVRQQTPRDDAWLEQLAKMRNRDGTYGKGSGTARDTGGAVVAVLRLGGKVENRDRVVQALKAGQRDDGGFGKQDAPGSDLETTYRVERAFVMLKERPDAERCRAFVGKCRNADGGYGVAPGQPSSVSATYFASIILHWLAEK
jgi:hypothetical protein